MAAYNHGSEGLKTRTIRGLLNAGADLMLNMYDVKIYFPKSDGSPDLENAAFSYPITVRADGFKVNDVETDTYEVKYHGVSIWRPKTELKFERKFELTFREDAAFELRKRFSAWHMATADPVTGGVSNATKFFGQIEVGTLVGEYYARTVAPGFTNIGETTYVEKADAIENDIGQITSNVNPLAFWAFYNVWVTKVGGIEFKTETADANKFTVGFAFMDCDLPMYGGNALDVGVAGWENK